MSGSRRSSAVHRGMTLIEVMIALVVLSVGILAVVSAIISSMTTVDHNREEYLAMTACRQKIAEMEDAVFTNLFQSYNIQPNGVAKPQNPFAVNALTGAIGVVIFPVDNAGQLSETITTTTVPSVYGSNPAYSTLNMGGGKVDMNGNGTPTTAGVGGEGGISGNPGSYSALPVCVRVRWQGVTGVKEVNFNTVLVKIR
jgi:prepilin-type N-terminal cleavage/methylation domain-containing protein